MAWIKKGGEEAPFSPPSQLCSLPPFRGRSGSQAPDSWAAGEEGSKLLKVVMGGERREITEMALSKWRADKVGMEGAGRGERWEGEIGKLEPPGWARGGGEKFQGLKHDEDHQGRLRGAGQGQREGKGTESIRLGTTQPGGRVERHAPEGRARVTGTSGEGGPQARTRTHVPRILLSLPGKRSCRRKSEQDARLGGEGKPARGRGAHLDSKEADGGSRLALGFQPRCTGDAPAEPPLIHGPPGKARRGEGG